MVDWKSAAVKAEITKAIDDLDLVLLGIMLWECVVTLPFDVSVLAMRKPWKWPVAIYWLTKWGSLAFIIITNVNGFGVRVNCQATSDLANFTSGLGMIGASSLLMMRAVALWGRDLRVVIPLSILHAGQWAVTLHNAFIAREKWSTKSHICIVTSVTSWPWIRTQYLYTMIFDFIVLVLVCTALYRYRMSGQSNLYKVLFVDGVCYFVLAFSWYLACTISAWMSFDIIVTYMVSDTATICVAIASCRSFVRLITSRSDHGVTSITNTQPLTTLQFANPPLQVAKPTFSWNSSLNSRDLEKSPPTISVDTAVGPNRGSEVPWKA